MALTYDDIDWEKGEMHITKNLTDAPNNTAALVTPKTAAGNRTVKLTPHTMKLLRRSYAEYKELKLRTVDFVDSRRIVHKKDGSGMMPHSMYSKFRRAAKKLGLPQIRLHALRSTSITLAIENGAPLKAVSQRVGHIRTSLTSDIYLQNTEHMKTKAAEVMEDILNQAVGH